MKINRENEKVLKPHVSEILSFLCVLGHILPLQIYKLGMDPGGSSDSYAAHIKWIDVLLVTPYLSGSSGMKKRYYSDSLWLILFMIMKSIPLETL